MQIGFSLRMQIGEKKTRRAKMAFMAKLVFILFYCCVDAKKSIKQQYFDIAAFTPYQTLLFIIVSVCTPCLVFLMHN